MALDRMHWLRKIASLDPETDYEEIYRIDSMLEFPWDMNQSLGLALYRTYAVPSIGSLLARTGEFTERTQKRYDDTGLILTAIGEHGLDSTEGRAAIRRMNQMHCRYGISNDDMRYVLSTIVTVPIRWLDEYGYRRLTTTEKIAGANYYRRLGELMNIKDLPATWQEFGDLMDAYEREHFGYDEGGVAVSEATLALMATFPPNNKAPRHARAPLGTGADGRRAACRVRVRRAHPRRAGALPRGDQGAGAAAPARAGPHGPRALRGPAPGAQLPGRLRDLGARDLRRRQVVTSPAVTDRPRLQDHWQAIGFATAVASAVLIGAVLLAGIRPAGRRHGPLLLVLLVTLLLASLAVLSAGQYRGRPGFEISLLGLVLGGRDRRAGRVRRHSGPAVARGARADPGHRPRRGRHPARDGLPERLHLDLRRDRPRPRRRRRARLGDGHLDPSGDPAQMAAVGEVTRRRWLPRRRHLRRLGGRKSAICDGSANRLHSVRVEC